MRPDWIGVSWSKKTGTLKMKSFHIPCKTMNTFVQVLLGSMRQSLQLKELNMYYYKATGSHRVKNNLLIPIRDTSAWAATVLQWTTWKNYFLLKHAALFYTTTVHCLSNSTQIFFAMNKPKVISLFKDFFPSAKAVEAKITLVVWQVSDMNFITPEDSYFTWNSFMVLVWISLVSYKETWNVLSIFNACYWSYSEWLICIFFNF